MHLQNASLMALVVNQSNESFEELEKKLKPYINDIIKNYLNNKILMTHENASSIYNHSLYKMFEVKTKFIFNNKIPVWENNKKFFALLKISINNMLRDMIKFYSYKKRNIKDTHIVNNDSGEDIDVEYVDNSFDKIEVDDILSEANKKLDTRCRKILSMRFDGYTIRDISKVVGVSSSTVAYLLTNKIKPALMEK